MDTGEIASKLSYSERTVKNVMHGLTTRLHLRNRAHAVAYARGKATSESHGPFAPGRSGRVADAMDIRRCTAAQAYGLHHGTAGARP